MKNKNWGPIDWIREKLAENKTPPTEKKQNKTILFTYSSNIRCSIYDYGQHLEREG